MATNRNRNRYRRDRFRRSEQVRASYDVVLIVCEGKKTEPRYFEGLRRAYSLSNANISVAPFGEPGGNDPLSIVRYGITKLTEARGDLDHVYCVFDRNGHATFDKACRVARESEFGVAGRLHVVPSWPCFELWVLLHFEYTTTPFNSVGGKTSCARVIDRIKTHYADYEKDFENVFDVVFSRTDAALERGQRLQADNQRAQSVNPSTGVHRLVAKLRGLRPDIP